MATMFGRFEIQSELSKSETALIYKAMDTETNQVVALKTQSLEPLGDRADAFVETLIAEGESTRDLVGQNIVLLYGAGEIDGQFCAAMEYVQGNSVATMLARKEGFSIWDLQDIARQTCQGLDHAHAKSLVHYTLEPPKLRATLREFCTTCLPNNCVETRWARPPTSSVWAQFFTRWSPSVRLLMG